MSIVMIERNSWSLVPRVTRRVLLVCWLAIVFAGYFLNRMVPAHAPSRLPISLLQEFCHVR
jgi:hypothetical protein